MLGELANSAYCCWSANWPWSCVQGTLSAFSGCSQRCEWILRRWLSGL